MHLLARSVFDDEGSRTCRRSGRSVHVRNILLNSRLLWSNVIFQSSSNTKKIWNARVTTSSSASNLVFFKKKKKNKKQKTKNKKQNKTVLKTTFRSVATTKEDKSLQSFASKIPSTELRSSD